MTRTDVWTSADMPDQDGRRVLITGANSGLGLATATAFAQRGATVILAVRDTARGQDAADRILAGHPDARLEVQQTDLSSLTSVRTAAQQIHDRHDRLDVLINNAGVMWTPETRTDEGFELQFATNHLGHFALTGLLLDLLERSTAARIVTVASNGHRAGRINFDDLNATRRYNGQTAYSQSKLANLLFTYELQRRLHSTGRPVEALAAHPGGSATGLTRNAPLHMRMLNTVLGPIVTQSPRDGALPVLRAATDPRAKGGEYYGPAGLGEMRGRPRRTTSSARSHDQADAQRLWAVSETLTGVLYR
ncbi:hypothetical protein FB565_008554 [Actinoplanes lutulentus]|uniref:NAD(P)-dependent dehydrogenase (Short-subunit alcohol dehydrogenase family) n=1 Tax=Actinoplanes lutulentus TaxID=1287878 RepID=A0A327Z4K4_9ACTN|nr:oxidoreductase [Actinoplanes lutulentus]MBB2948768.1 hypothetical protein [Actinoplanes lutulentus]RAK29680.1 hypothetical protein B0I29_1176 [Actinoplanes lutulentus]